MEWGEEKTVPPFQRIKYSSCKASLLLIELIIIIIIYNHMAALGFAIFLCGYVKFCLKTKNKRPR